MRVPTTIKQLPRLLSDLSIRRRIIRRPLPRQSTFRLCYFSCHSYFKFLVCAIHSLKSAASGIRCEIIVFNDIDMPMSDQQIETLQCMVSGLRVVPWPKSMGWGVEQITRIWQAYALAAEGMHDDDFIARVDADVFFFNDTIFQAVQRSDADMVGDGHFIDFEYCQGGCYFLRVSAVRKIVSLLASTPIANLAEQFTPIVEDVAATYLVRWAGMQVWMTWFMMFPDELRNAGGLSRVQRAKFSCAHFVMKNKMAMLDTYEREVLPASELAAFRALMEAT